MCAVIESVFEANDAWVRQLPEHFELVHGSGFLLQRGQWNELGGKDPVCGLLRALLHDGIGAPGGGRAAG